MSKFIALTKTLIKSNSYLNLIDENNSKKTYLLLFLVFFSIAPIVYGLLRFTLSFYDTLKGAEQEGLILSLSFSSISLLIFFSSIITIMGVLYFSLDINTLLPLPYSPRALIASKFIVMLTVQYLIECFTLLPILIGFGSKNGIGLYYLLYGLVSFLTLPIIPLSIATIIVMVVMVFTNMGQKKDQLKIFGGIITIILSMAFYLSLQKDMGNLQSLASVENIIALGNHSLINFTSTLFPSTNLLAKALLQETLIENLMVLGTVFMLNLIAVILLLVIGQWTYFKGVIGMSETPGKSEEISQKRLRAFSKKRPIQVTYMLKEVRIILRTPAYLLNCVLGNFLWLLAIAMAYFTTDQIDQNIEQISKYLKITQWDHILVTLAFLIVFLSSTFNSIVQTSISREGSGFSVNKYLPIPYNHQLEGKILSGLFFAGINLVILLPLLIIGFQIPFFLILIFLASSILGVLFVSFTGLLIDLYNPKLDWSREQSAVKQNINVLLAFVPVLLITGLFIGIALVFDLSFYWLFLTLIALLSLMDVMLYRLLMHSGTKLFAKI